ncbi:hypothetical protein CHU98_g4223 [Xylaria longipes]|nr:hypothetical protein CHU98_g4223 [Xylaria longipes]
MSRTVLHTDALWRHTLVNWPELELASPVLELPLNSPHNTIPDDLSIPHDGPQSHSPPSSPIPSSSNYELPTSFVSSEAQLPCPHCNFKSTGKDNARKAYLQKHMKRHNREAILQRQHCSMPRQGGNRPASLRIEPEVDLGMHSGKVYHAVEEALAKHWWGQRTMSLLVGPEANTVEQFEL